ncbi:MAG: hypothetical protein ACP5VP_08055 [Candidatus Limnocylindrales bacterium]
MREAAMGLARAHVKLLRAELEEGIIADLKVIAALAGAILAVAFFLSVLLTVGGTLFVGSWLFGSIGWGVALGGLLSVALIVALGMVLVGAPGPVVTVPLAWGVVVGIVAAVVLGANLARRAAAHVGTQLRAGPLPDLDPAWAPALVGIVTLAVILGLVGLVALGRVGGSGGAVSGLVLGAVGGALVGWGWTGLTFSWHGAVAIGIALGLLAWIVLMPAWMLRAGVDPTARFRRLWPKESYDAAMETKDWLESEWQKRRAKLGRT